MKKVTDASQPKFEAEILDKKQKYKLGDYIYFRTRYKGKLVNGFFDNEIYAPVGTTFPDGQDHTWRWSMDTLESTLENDATAGKYGKLNGEVDHESKWHFIIERNFPKGVYRVDMRVYNQYDPTYRLSRTVIANKEDTFEVV